MRTKIIVTLGPSCSSENMIEKLMLEGADIFRFNFSHCTEASFREWYEILRRLEAKHGRKIAVLQDLQGPRIRVGELPQEGVTLSDGQAVRFSTNPEDKEAIYINDPYLHGDLAPGDPLFLANGEMEAKVLSLDGASILTTIVRGGILYSRKGVNVPHTKVTTSGLTEKDARDIAFVAPFKVDFTGISFVQNAADIRKARTLINPESRIVAKIETRQALQNIDEIIQEADAVMIARGDLGIEIPVEQLPFVQKNLIRHAGWHHKPSITATQMLFSMVNHANPTRAEVSDVANAVWDGTDAVMLSDETASGRYPLESLQAMVRIVKETEASRSAESTLI